MAVWRSPSRSSAGSSLDAASSDTGASHCWSTPHRLPDTSAPASRLKVRAAVRWYWPYLRYGRVMEVRDKESEESTEQSPPTRQPRPVRLTLDISPGRHAELQRWCLDAVPAVGRPRVAGQQVMRALLARLLTDEGLSRAIISDLRRHLY